MFVAVTCLSFCKDYVAKVTRHQVVFLICAILNFHFMNLFILFIWLVYGSNPTIDPILGGMF